MKRSANEIATHVLKAARGAGVPLGVAEDLGIGSLYMPPAALAELAKLLNLPDGQAKLANLCVDLDAYASGAGGDDQLHLPDIAAALVSARRLGTDQAAPELGRRDVPDAIWAGLDIHARKTYVPASEASRNSGAGAGLTDND